MAAIGREEDHGEENHEDRSMIASPKRITRTVPVILRWVAAAAVVLAVVWGATTIFSPGSEEECVAYIYGQRITDRNVVMNELSQTALSMANSRGDDDVARQLDEMFNIE